MMMNKVLLKQYNIWAEEVQVRFNEVGKNMELTPLTYLNYMQHSAAAHIETQGYGLNFLHQQNHSWILYHLRLKIHSLPDWNESLLVQTWQPGIEKLFALRDFEIRRSDGSVCAQASSRWLAIQRESGKVLRPDTYLASAKYHKKQVFPNWKPGRFYSVADNTFCSEYIAGSEDIDMNGHVNNVRYVAWVIQSSSKFHLEPFQLEEVNIQYKGQCREGENITVFSACVEEESNEEGYSKRYHTFHTIVNLANGDCLGHASLKWKT